jgi:putative two-component system response regulator
MLTSLQTREDTIAGLNAGADDYFSTPASPRQLRARIRSLVRLKRLSEDLASTEAVMLTLAATIEERDPHIQHHCQRVAAYATALGVQLDLSDADLVALHRAAFLHDIGMVAVPDAILLKPGRLTGTEMAAVRQHPVIGERLCGELHALSAVRPIVRSHHERYDGSGYPDGLRGDAIPLTAQVLGIADAYDAMTTAHPHRPARSSADALLELLQDVQRGWRRKDLVAAFVTLASTHRLDRLAPVLIEEPYQASLMHAL